MPEMIPISEARDRLAEIVRTAADDDVLLLRHSRPVAVVMSHERHEALLDQLEELSDTIAVLRADPADAIPWDEAVAELDDHQPA